MPRLLIGGADFNGQRAINAADGSAPGDLVTKAQLDSVARGLDWKNSVRVATTANITTSGTQTIDGVALSVGDRVLVKDQSTASQNGIYAVATGSWSRAADFDDSTEVTSAAAVAVESGTANGDTVWLLATDGAITVGTTALSFTRLGGTGVSYTPGNGLALSGSQFSVVAASGGGISVGTSGVSIDPAYTGLAKRFAQDVPATATSTITHNLNTTDVTIAVYRKSDGVEVDADVSVNYANPNVVNLVFPVAPSTGQYRIVIVG